jgi:hypothetical protein
MLSRALHRSIPVGVRHRARLRNWTVPQALSGRFSSQGGDTMGFGRGILLWLLGVPLPIIILLALFWHS